MPNVRGYSDEERQARVNALRSKYAAEDAANDDKGTQFVNDLTNNIMGLPEAALTMGTGMAAQAGTGLGVGAGVLADVVRGGVGIGPKGLSLKKPDWDAAGEVANENTGRFTFAPRSEGGKATTEGLGTVMEPLDAGMNYVGEKVSEGTGSPLAGALTYAGLNMLDPEHLAPTVAALKGSAGLKSLIREAGPSPGVSSAGRMGKQRGAWTAGDIADTPGDFTLRSPTVEAFSKLKPQEQKNLSGKQLMKALTREGAKKEELQWMGLDKVLDTDEVMSVADVRKLAESNEPKIEYAQARSGSDTKEIDEDALNDAVHEAVSNDDDLRYPVQVMHREPGARRWSSHDDAPSSFDTEEEAQNWIEEHKTDWIKQQADHNLENIGDVLSEEELAGMSDEDKQRWAQESAESDVDELLGEFQTEPDYDSDAVNRDELYEYHERRAREDPSDYGLEGGGQADAPDYGEYTVGQHGSEPEANYTVATGKLAGESRFGRNMDDPGFLQPYARAEEAAAIAKAEGSPQMSLLPDEANQSKAFQREALRRGQIAEDPNKSDYTRQSNLSHYRDMGKNQMYFTRETHRPAPEWGTVKEGIGRVEDTGLSTAEGEALPDAGKDNPLALLEEAQSDWYQKGRKTGWADPKDIEKVRKQKVDKVAQIEAFKQQAVGELDNLWANPHVADAIKRTIAAEGPDGYLQGKLDHWQQLQPGGDLAGTYDSPAALQDARIAQGRNILRELSRTSHGVPEADALISQTQQGMEQLDNMGDIPGAEDLTPTGPMRETPQYTQLAMADALRRAVQEGKQYFGWTPGDVHAHRWGSESMQFAPSAENPREMRARFGGGRDMDDRPGTVLEKFQERANELLGEHDGDYEYNLDDPELDKKLHEAVESNLNYGMSDYPDPNAARGKRAALIRKQMEELAAQAAAGDRKAAHYSPRAVGYEQAYGPMEKHLIDILRRSGVKPPEIRDIMLKAGERESEVPMRGFEIDPDLARAAKRGFIMPY